MAVASGFSKIELDIRRCKPDSNGKATWVISHNDSLKNTMGVSVDISDSTYSELLKYSYTKGNNVDAYSNLKIATLDQVIDLIKKYKSEGKKVNWQIEIKSVSDSNYPNYFESNEVMEKTMYYGYLLEYGYKNKNNNYADLGMDAYQVVKYVYRGAEKVEDISTQENLKQIAKDLDKIK